MSAGSAALAAATVGNGLTAGLFLGFTCAVMPGLARVDDAGFVAAMRSINRAIQNPLFGLVLVGTPLATVAATVARPASPWLLAGLVATAATLAITLARNVPLNVALDRASGGGPAQLTAARAAFERPWRRWNALRTLTGTAATALLAVAVGAGAASSG
ncbi:DUF1772 domain-containing protein [Georgenia sp. Z1491]|uniref:anthrone oxygenase family protein n=1 Tax=Georgenia sp. Z1491 TaxID=3416707 RepID=UPI003CF23FFF